MEIVVVVPCFNEAARLEGDRFTRFAAAEPAIRFLFVNDGSDDGTGQMLDELARDAAPSMEVRHLPRNVGKAEAVRQGILAALASDPFAVAYWDADLSTGLSVIPEFRRVLLDRPEVVAVIGSRVRRLGRSIRRSPVRHYLGRGFATLASTFLRLPFHDTQCGAKAFRVDEHLPRLFERPFRSRWIFDVELISRLSRSGDGPIVEVPLDAWHDVAGSKLRPRHVVTAFFDLVRIWRSGD